ncbi:hypothetical protein EPI10_027929 [Gossypium australe]|uniref:Uncharacterized protein n=1 Tax=Gossypium australe TaxID=47621 RepID=A0A5B6UVD4_9ROSI|nr:hypothetical protein EPI10_027929 [Gossypium australe]
MGIIKDGAKVKKDLERRGVEELSKAMIISKSLLELNVKKSEMSEFSKPKFKPKGNGEGDKDKAKNNSET